MRLLNTRDMFSFGRVIRQLNMAEKLRKIAKDANSISDIWNGGFDLVYMIFERAVEEEAETAIYKALSGPLEIPVEQIPELPFTELISMLKQLAKENDLMSFFGKAAALSQPSS